MNDTNSDVRPLRQPGVDPTQVKRWPELLLTVTELKTHDLRELAKRLYAESKKRRRA